MNRQLFDRRRKEFMSQMVAGSVAVFAAAPVRLRNGDVEYEYRQDSDFYYLTGYEEPESFCVLLQANEKYNYLLFVRPRDKEQETWTGIRSGVEGSILEYGADMAFPVDRLEEMLTELLQNAPVLYYSVNKYPELDQRVFRILEVVRQKHRQGIYPPSTIIDPAAVLAEMRIIKTPEELELFQHAVDISP